MNLPAGALVLVTALLVLPIVAFATPPDAVWVPGFYDGADGDDAVTLITESAAAQEGITFQPVHPPVSSEVIVTRAPGTRESFPALRPPRGPPQSSFASVDCFRDRLGHVCSHQTPHDAHRRPPGIHGERHLCLGGGFGALPETVANLDQGVDSSRGATMPASNQDPSRREQSHAAVRTV